MLCVWEGVVSLHLSCQIGKEINKICSILVPLRLDNGNIVIFWTNVFLYQYSSCRGVTLDTPNSYIIPHH